MEPVDRAVRVPADDCPNCDGSDTHTASMERYGASTFPEYGPLGSMRVRYHCSTCNNTWACMWAVEFVA